MKKFINAITGKKAFYVALASTLAFTALEIITSFKTGMRVTYAPITIAFIGLTFWAESIEVKGKHTNNN